MAVKRLLLTSGEPAGIGPDLAILLSQQTLACEVITLACPALIQARAKQLNITVDILPFAADNTPSCNQQGQIKLLAVPTASDVIAGQLDQRNAHYVLQLLDSAIALCQAGKADAIVTAPVQKSIINEAGIAFSGHTEYFAEKTDTEKVVMMLASDALRVALVTTHLPLKDVASAITATTLEQVIRILHHDLQKFWGIASPHILVAGLNPHAGEGGHLGHEEIDTIIPVLARLRAHEGMNLQGPLPADTLFTQKYLQHSDAVLAMYHDQGLPVLKYQGFGYAANITLGLPIIRTSVDHGTALDLAGTGNIAIGSLLTAINTAQHMAENHAR